MTIDRINYGEDQTNTDEFRENAASECELSGEMYRLTRRRLTQLLGAVGATVYAAPASAAPEKDDDQSGSGTDAANGTKRQAERQQGHVPASTTTPGAGPRIESPRKVPEPPTPEFVRRQEQQNFKTPLDNIEVAPQRRDG